MLGLLLAAFVLLPGTESPVTAPFAASPSFRPAPKVAEGRSVRLVVWNQLDDETGENQLRAVPLTYSGVLLDVPPIVLSRNYDASSSPAVAFNGSEFIVVWSEITRTHGAGLVYRLVYENGTADAGGGLSVSSYDARPAIACGESECVLPIAAILDFIRNDRSGISNYFLPEFGGSGFLSYSTIAFGDHAYVVGYVTSAGLVLTFVREDGSVIRQVKIDAGHSFADYGNKVPVHLAWNGAEFLAVWQRVAGDELVLYGQRFASSGEALSAPQLIDSTGITGVVQDVASVAASWLITFSGQPSASGLYISPALQRERAFEIAEGAVNPTIATAGVPAIVYARAVSDAANGPRMAVFMRPLDDLEAAAPPSSRRRASSR